MKIKILIVIAALMGCFHASASEVDHPVQGSIEEELMAEEVNDVQTTDMDFQASPFSKIPIHGSPFRIYRIDATGPVVGGCSCSKGQEACMKVRGRNHKGFESNRICRGTKLYQTGCYTYRRYGKQIKYLYHCSRAYL